MYEYDREFYRYISQGAVHSARQMLPLLVSRLPAPPARVLDVGCGAGAWLSVWKEQGAEVTGLDGDYVDRRELLIDAGEFMPCDISRGFDLQRRFDVVQCLEVAEHLPADTAPILVESLCRHAPAILFSAATPGQGGENHINEQPYAYWRDLFAAQGYAMYDPLRPQVHPDRSIMPWYRYNSFLYIDQQAPEEILKSMEPYKLDPAMPPPDFSPLLYRARKSVTRLLPSQTSTLFAVAKKTLFNMRRRVRDFAGQGQT